ncbi:hypothetical protein [Actinomadura xylanilytica]|uniref:hypothetical protein n=1 Tax=Actinomadura xylanilytica TaxID=887459 RepID=UPI00255ACCBB|nr:hypothetical protein [Actinomadura xylanilytica]MDL4775881.1 hypothetical protein [Actinomadura xylanilytica]
MKPWVGVPCELSELFRPHLDTLAEEMIDEILAGIPEYSRPHDGEYARLVRLAVEGALQQFVDLIGTPESSWEAVAGVYREIGRAEAWEGRSLDVLQTLLRLGARVAWRRLAAESEQTNVSRRTLASIAEAIFAFLDEIARAAPEGYTKARAGGGRAGAPAPPAARPGPARLGGGDGPDGPDRGHGAVAALGPRGAAAGPPRDPPVRAADPLRRAHAGRSPGWRWRWC